MSTHSSPWLTRPVIAWLLAAVIMTAPPSISAESTPPERPPQAEEGDVLNFSLLDYRGQHYELRRTDARLVVLFFTAPGCPIARQNAPKVQAISEEFGGKGVAVWMINAMPQNDPDDRALDMLYEIGKFAPKERLGDRYAVQGMRGLVAESVLGDRETLRMETRDHVWGDPPLPPVLRDEHQLVTRYFQVKRTCDTIVIDVEESAVIYRGAVDDQFVEGARKPEAKAHYLRDAVTAFLAGKPIALPKTRAHGCAVTYMTGDDDEPISYVEQVAPIVRDNCVSCHSRGNIGPFAMNSFNAVAGRSQMIQEVLLDRRMPPWHADPHHGKFVNDRSLSGAEAQALLRWIQQGCPRGEGDDPLPALTPPSPEWGLGEPNFIIRLPKQQIPATGTVDYRYIDADFVMPQDAWLRAAVTKPGNPEVIHHIIVRVKYPDGREANSEAYLFTTWVPGLPQGECPPGTGFFIPKGSRFNFEVHYVTTGNAQTDESEVGLYLAKEPPKMRLETRACQTRDLNIPPAVRDAQHTAMYCFKRDTMLFGLSPHMHLRGSWVKFQLLYPHGRRQTLLSVPNYDFNWQTSYRLAEPIRIPAGSWMLCAGGFDNSAHNPHNPDATVRVRWGPQSWNEMFMGFMDVAELPAEDAATAAP